MSLEPWPGLHEQQLTFSEEVMGQMKGRVVLMTGAAGAIGKPMCVELARRGATVVMAGLYLDATVRTRLWTESARLVGLR